MSNTNNAVAVQALENNGRINLEFGLRLLITEAAERVKLDGKEPECDAVVLALRTALCAYVREKAFDAVESAHEQLEEALNQDRATLAQRGVVAEIRVRELEQKSPASGWLEPRKSEEG